MYNGVEAATYCEVLKSGMFNGFKAEMVSDALNKFMTNHNVLDYKINYQDPVGAVLTIVYEK